MDRLTPEQRRELAERDYKGRLPKKKTHLRYSDQSPDLAVCSDLRGAIVDPAYLTSDESAVTCKCCRSIRCLETK